MQIISNIALISINETLFVQLISFLIFLFVINRIMFRPLRAVMGERDSHIDQLNREIEEAEGSLDKFLAELQQRESKARAEAVDIRRELESAGTKQASEILSSARHEIDTLKQAAEKDAAAQLAEARKRLQTESEILAVNVMEKLLDRRLTQ